MSRSSVNNTGPANFNANPNHNNLNHNQAHDNGLSQLNVGDMKTRDFMANITASITTNIGIMMDTKLRDLEERLADREDAIIDRMDKQDDQINVIYEHIENLTARFNTLNNEVTTLRNNPVAPANAPFGHNKHRILHGTWRINQDGKP